MKTKRHILTVASVLVALMASGCELPSVISKAAPPQTVGERKAKAAALARQGDLAGALVEWRIVEAMTGRDAEVVRQRRKVESEIDRKASAKVEAGRKAAAKGSIKTARRHYLAALEVDPNHEGAIEALRRIEVVRVRRSRPKMVEPKPYRGVAAAPAGTAKPAASAQGAAKPKPAETSTAARSAALEQAVALAKQGYHTRAIGRFEAYLKKFPGDRDARALLSSSHRALGMALYKEDKLEQSIAHLQKAEAGKDPVAARMLADARGRLAQDAYEKGIRVFRKDVVQAIALWEESLAYDPAHAKAKSYLDKAYKIQDTLNSLKQ